MSYEIIQGDCLAVLARPEHQNRYALAVLDTPYNQGLKYDTYQDNLPKSIYLKQVRRWLEACHTSLLPNGSIYTVISDEYAAEFKIALEDAGFTMRNWLVWSYGFGNYCVSKFGRCKAHILYAVKNSKEFIFNDNSIRVPSARQTIYKDKRANPLGKIPTDVWDFSRVCGTFDERTAHPCQMPEALLERIVLASSNPGDTILDPFAGSFTTGVAAIKYERNFVGMEMSEAYCQIGQGRMNARAREVFLAAEARRSEGEPVLPVGDEALGCEAGACLLPACSDQY